MGDGSDLEISWFSSGCKEGDTAMFNYLELLGSVAKNIQNNEEFVSLIKKYINDYKTINHSDIDTKIEYDSISKTLENKQDGIVKFRIKKELFSGDVVEFENKISTKNYYFTHIKYIRSTKVFDIFKIGNTVERVDTDNIEVKIRKENVYFTIGKPLEIAEKRNYIKELARSENGINIENGEVIDINQNVYENVINIKLIDDEIPEGGVESLTDNYFMRDTIFSKIMINNDKVMIVRQKELFERFSNKKIYDIEEIN